MNRQQILGAVLTLIGALVYILRPAPLAGILFTNFYVSFVFYVTFGIVVGILLFGKRQIDRVDPSNKAVVITGCDSGFGHSLALRLHNHGYTVFAGCLFADREGARELRDLGSDRMNVLQLDVTDDWQVRSAVKQAKQYLNQDKVLWAVVNNAGIAFCSEIEWCSVIQFQQLLDVNVIGVVRVTKAFLPLVRQSHGRIINVASLAGRFTFPTFTAYSMSKKACIAFSDGLRLEMAKFNVSVITVEPGLYRTPITSEDHLISMNRKSWAETPTDVKNDYGEEYFDAFLKHMSEHVRRARSNVFEVIDQMEDAVTSRHPHYRYVPYWISYIRSTILTYLPTSVTDKFFQRYCVKADVSAKKHS